MTPGLSSVTAAEDLSSIWRVENLKAYLTEFVAWHKKHITGDEKGQAQIFLDRLFKAFGHDGVLDAGGQTEFRVRKAQEDGGGTAFADLVWKPVVLVEMKKRGTDLSRHYRQAFDYWIRLVPGRPRYVVLCNFDEFRIYDFETQMDTPVDVVATVDLPARWGPLAFLAQMKPVFGNDRVGATREAADALANCFKLIVHPAREPQVPRATAQQFILQMLVALFAEDIDLLPKYMVATLLDECKSPTDTYDLIGGLFEAMNRRDPAIGGRYKGVPYFNGGLFTVPARLELQEAELTQLRHAARFDWSKVQPEIFGTLFQHSMEKEERHAFGAHFTLPVDIMKIVGPTIVEPWRAQVEGAKTLTQLNALLERLHHFRVLDPACGSGNFLYVAYRELKRVEARIFERMELEFKSEAKKSGQMRLSFLSAQNFYGMDILPFAVEIAKVTMMIARKLAIDELHITEPALPLDNLDQNFIAADALIDAEGKQAPWPAADVVIGNPPFLGAKKLKPAHGAPYMRLLRRAYPEVPGMADYCVYWIRRSHDHVAANRAEDPVGGRCGLVGTQNIRNNNSREGGLDYVAKTGTIVEAVDNQPWSGEANVHVSIANWVKTRDEDLLPRTRKLWFKLVPTHADKAARIKRAGSVAAKEYELDFRECAHINSALSDQTDVSEAKFLECNAHPPCVFNGQFPRHKGFVLTPEQAAALIAKDPANREVVHPFLIGAEMLKHGAPQRWVIDFQKMGSLEARRYDAPFRHVEHTVLPHVEALAAKERKKTGKDVGQDQQWLKSWWQHFRSRKELIDAIDRLPRYLVCCEVTKRPIFCFIDPDIRPDHTVEAFVLADDYSFGILQSSVHWLWFITKCSKLKSDFRYTPEFVFDTFPWPQAPAKPRVTAVVEAVREVQRIRAESLAKKSGGLRALYRMLELPGENPLKAAQAALDDAVLAAYGFSAKKDLLAQILALNLEVARRIEKGEAVTAPGVPTSYPDKAKLISEDRIKPPVIA